MGLKGSPLLSSPLLSSPLLSSPLPSFSSKPPALASLKTSRRADEQTNSIGGLRVWRGQVVTASHQRIASGLVCELAKAKHAVIDCRTRSSPCEHTSPPPLLSLFYPSLVDFLFSHSPLFSPCSSLCDTYKSALITTPPAACSTLCSAMRCPCESSRRAVGAGCNPPPRCRHKGVPSPLPTPGQPRQLTVRAPTYWLTRAGLC